MLAHFLLLLHWIFTYLALQVQLGVGGVTNNLFHGISHFNVIYLFITIYLNAHHSENVGKL